VEGKKATYIDGGEGKKEGGCDDVRGMSWRERGNAGGESFQKKKKEILAYLCLAAGKGISGEREGGDPAIRFVKARRGGRGGGAWNKILSSLRGGGERGERVKFSLVEEDLVRDKRRGRE